MALKWKRWVLGDFSWKRLLLSLVEIYVLVMVGGYLVSDRLIFAPQETYYHLDEPGFSTVPLGEEQALALYETGNAGDPALLYIHGNAEDLGDLRPLFRDYAAKGFRVFSFDYRGYGRSPGRPSFAKAMEDAESAYQHLVRERGVDPKRLIVLGRSVGAAFAIPLAVRHPVGGLVVQSGFVSAFRTVTRYPLFPLDKGRNERDIRRVQCPVLVIHGLRDEIIPSWHGEALFAAAPEPRRLLRLPGAGHDDVPEAGGQAYWTALTEFASGLAGNTP